MRLGSLFSGIGGLELGLEAALGCETIWQVEMDDYARQVLERGWPGADRAVRDVREAGAHNLEPVDVLCGGFPCQGLSVAGKGKGLEDERSSLWFEMLRIIRELRPPVVILENVPAIRTRGLDVVLGGLASVGYDAEWGVYGAADVGAPHRRQRWYCIAYLPDSLSPGIWLQQRRRRRQTWQDQTQPELDGPERVLAHTTGERRPEGPQREPVETGPMRGDETQEGRHAQVAHRDGRRLEGERVQKPAWEQGPSGGESDGCGGLRGGNEAQVANAPSLGGTPPVYGEGPEQARAVGCGSMANPQGERPPLREREREDAQQELSAALRASGGSAPRDVERRLGGAAHGFQGWSYIGEEVESWEQDIPRVVPKGHDKHRVARLRCLGNSVVPMWAYWVGVKALGILYRECMEVHSV